MNKRIIQLVIETCDKCPYYNWDENSSEPNDAGISFCTQEDQNIERNNKCPKIPIWCPLPKLGEMLKVNEYKK